MANKENLPPTSSPAAISRLSPNNRPALSRQRDHSACGKLDTPLKVKKTRENLKQYSIYTDILPPCVHAHHHNEELSTPISSASTLVAREQASTSRRQQRKATIEVANRTAPRPSAAAHSLSSFQTESHVQRQKSVSRRMIARVKQSIGPRSTTSQSVRPTESETSLVRRFSGRRTTSRYGSERSHSFEIIRSSLESNPDWSSTSVERPDSAVQRSFTDSTVSTAELLGEETYISTPVREVCAPSSTHSGLSPIASTPSPPSSSPPQPTPRPPPKSALPAVQHPARVSLSVPCIELCVTLDFDSVDVSSKRDIWVSVQATVRQMPSTLQTGPNNDLVTADYDEDPGRATQTVQHSRGFGDIPSLRLCYKAVGGCAIREVIGQKSARDPVIGQQCSLFIKVHVPRIRIRDSSHDPDQDSLFTELESIVGTLKTEILHVEARYRHSLLPRDNVISVRQTCKIRRPKSKCRWSTVGSDAGVHTSDNDVLTPLAKYIASRYPAAQALDLLQQHIGSDIADRAAILSIHDSLQGSLSRDNNQESVKPSVIVTDIDIESGLAGHSASENFSTAPSTPASTHNLSTEINTKLDRKCTDAGTSVSIPPLNTASKWPPQNTTSTNASNTNTTTSTPDNQDSAHQLWRHIRRTSLTTKQLAELTMPERIVDDTMSELRQKAIANKRSIGAETLKAWKWDHATGPSAEAEVPWM